MQQALFCRGIVGILHGQFARGLYRRRLSSRAWEAAVAKAAGTPDHGRQQSWLGPGRDEATEASTAHDGRRLLGLAGTAAPRGWRRPPQFLPTAKLAADRTGSRRPTADAGWRAQSAMFGS